MITPEEFKQGEEDFKSRKYEEALGVAEELSGMIQEWSLDGRSINNSWFKDGQYLQITDTSIVALQSLSKKLVNDACIREIVFKEFDKAGWCFEFTSDKVIRFRPKQKSPEKPKPWYKKLWKIFGTNCCIITYDFPSFD